MPDQDAQRIRSAAIAAGIPLDQDDQDEGAAARIAELPDLGPNPKSSRLRPQYVEKDAALREDTDA